MEFEGKPVRIGTERETSVRRLADPDSLGLDGTRFEQ
jgi:hypothetical protein